MKARRIVTALILLAMLSCVSAATYYVSPAGAGTGNGTEGNEYSFSAAKSYANSHAGEEIIFLLSDGNYGGFSSATSRTNWVTWKAKTGSTPIFSSIYSGASSNVGVYLRFEGITVRKQADTSEGVVSIKKPNHVQLINVTIIGTPSNDGSSGIYLWGGGTDILIDGCTIKGTTDDALDSPFSYGIRSLGYDSVTVTNSDIRWTEVRAIESSGNNWGITNNNLHDLIQDGIYVAESPNNGAGHVTLIANNHIHDLHTNPAGEHTDCLQLSGTSAGIINHVIIRGNICNDSDHQAFWLNPNANRQGTGAEIIIENNIVYNTQKVGSPNAVSLPNNMNGVYIRNNVFNCRVISGFGNYINEFTGNILYESMLDFKGLCVDTAPANKPITIVKEEYNIVRKWTCRGDYVPNSTTKTMASDTEFNNLFVDAANGNYSPNPNGIICNGSLPNTQQGVAWAGPLPCSGGTTCTDWQTRQCGTTDVGECSYGTQTCSGGAWGTCTGAINPVTEICDSKDNDCDGQTDEDNVCCVGYAIESIANGNCSDIKDNDCDGAIDTADSGCQATGCTASSTSWQNSSFAAKTGSFTAELDLTPGAAGMNGVMGLSASSASSYANLACIVRFNSLGNFDVRNSSNYTADTNITYSAGKKYHFRLVVNVPSHNYSVYVTPDGGAEQVIAKNYSFRSEQANITPIANLGVVSESSSYNLCNFTITETATCTTAQLLNYISQWKTGNIPISTLMQKIGAWKAGNAC